MAATTRDDDASNGGGTDEEIMISEKDGDVEKGRLRLSQVKEKGVSESSSTIPIVVGEDDGAIALASSEESFSAANRSLVICGLVVLLGTAASAAFMYLGISTRQRAQNEQFQSSATETIRIIETAWSEYVAAGSYLHQACRRDVDSGYSITRQRFREVYEHMQRHVDVQAVEFAPNVTQQERSTLEAESRSFYAKFYPDNDRINYRGIIGFEPNATTGELLLQERTEQDFYFPAHFVEPVESNEAAIDLDLYSSQVRAESINTALSTWAPAVSARIKLVQETEPHAYSVLLLHPGMPLSTQPDLKPRDIAMLVIRIPALLKRATKARSSSSAYIYDSTDTVTGSSTEPPQFLGAVEVIATGESIFLPELPLTKLRQNALEIEETFVVGSRYWTVAVVDQRQVSAPFAILGGVILLVASIAIAFWVYSNARRVDKFNQIRSATEAEKASLLVDHSKKQAEAERELNDYIAHGALTMISAKILKELTERFLPVSSHFT